MLKAQRNLRLVTAPIAAAGLVAGYAVAVASGSRPLGGGVLAGFGLWCLSIWWQRNGRKTAILLATAGLVGFALSHVVALLIGAWPAVLLTATGVGAICWQVSDARALAGGRGFLAS